MGWQYSGKNYHDTFKTRTIIFKLVTFFQLGLSNLFRVLIYRILLKLKIHPVQKIRTYTIYGEFFFRPTHTFLKYSNDLFSIDKLKFGYFPFSGDYISFGSEIPNWHKNYFNNLESSNKNIDWWKIPDFDTNLGDVKTVWELSRFDWVVQLSILAVSGDKEAITLLNSRLNNWIQENPYYKGVNWKCGQEASIRVLHLILATLILGQSNNSSKPLISLVEAHIKRISLTISYAIAQNNNHGTSEAAALFIGSHFLILNGLTKYKHLESLGRKWLEERADKLFSNEGCFSQYSVNYHRLAIDTYSLCETYRKINTLPSFSNLLQIKIKKAIQWLEILTDPNTGDVPNIGANDGAQLFKMFNIGYRDFRNSIQWANLVFNERFIYSITQNQDKIYTQLGISVKSARKDNPIEEALIMGKEDGFFIYKKLDLLLVFRRPIFKFRPSHSDALHLDLCIGGENVLRDGGTYSYNTSISKDNYYKGVASHNSIQFDDRDQMPHLSRFLFGSWLKEFEFNFYTSKNSFIVSSAYIDFLKVYHKRELIISKKNIIVKDVFSGFNQTAKINWRVTPERFDFQSSNDKKNEINIDIRARIITGDFNVSTEFESKFYLYESNLPVLHKNLNYSDNFITNITWE